MVNLDTQPLVSALYAWRLADSLTLTHAAVTVQLVLPLSLL